jgi:ATP-dependent helicase HrpB
MMRFDSPLPIDAALPELTAALRAQNTAVLVAPPGAGKTTRVPLVLAEEEWAAGRRILVLEPRRIAARAAADRMAKTRGERVGDTVGLRVRFGSKVSAKTRIEVVTEGVFTRLVLDDPMLQGIAAVLFDEFHERSLDGDLGLALARDAQQGLREDLRLLVMSATIDGARIAALLGGAPVIASEGRAFPVETRYLGRDARPIEPQVADAIVRDARGSRLGAGVSARRGGNPPHKDAARRPARSHGRRRRALWRADRRRTGSRDFARPARPAQDRARDLDCGNLDHHRGRAHRDRLWPVPRAAL